MLMRGQGEPSNPEMMIQYSVMETQHLRELAFLQFRKSFGYPALQSWGLAGLAVIFWIR